MNNKYSINENEMNEVSRALDYATKSTDDSIQAFGSSMTHLQQSGLFGKGVSGLSSSLNGISQSVSNVQRKVAMQSDYVFSNELISSEKASSLTPPQDFVKTDTSKYNSINDIQLSKRDDKSVNDGQKTEEVNEIADNSIEDEEKLADITKKETEKVNEIADNSIQDEEKLYDLTGEQAKEFEEIANNSIPDEEKLYDLTGEESKEMSEIDDNSIDEEKKLQNITGEESTQVEDKVLDSLDNRQSANLSDISGGQEGMDASYSDETSSNGTTLSTPQTNNNSSGLSYRSSQGSTDEGSGGFSYSPSQSQGSTDEGSSNGFSYTPSDSDEEEKKKKEQQQSSDTNDLMNNFSMYQTMERMNEQTQNNEQQNING